MWKGFQRPQLGRETVCAEESLGTRMRECPPWAGLYIAQVLDQWTKESVRLLGFAVISG